MKVKSLSHVRLFETPWTAAYQAPPSMGFSRQEHWSGGIFNCSSSTCYKDPFLIWIYNNYWYWQFVFSLFFCLVTWLRGLSIVLIIFLKKLLAFTFFLLLVFYFLDFCSLLFQSAYFYSHTYSSFSGFPPWMFRPLTSDSSLQQTQASDLDVSP